MFKKNKPLGYLKSEIDLEDVFFFTNKYVQKTFRQFMKKFSSNYCHL